MGYIPKVVAITWYKDEEIYNKALSVFDDPSEMPATYKDYLAQYAAAYIMLTSKGFIPVTAELDPETFPDWCTERFLRPDARGRAAWENWKAMQYLREKGLLREPAYRDDE